jgi:putative SOS response-associated peptidase YedK
MCGRYTWHQKHKFPYAKNFPLPEPPSSVSYNRAPGQSHPVVLEKNNKVHWAFAEWGLCIGSIQNTSKSKPINARIESVKDKKIFHTALRYNRCLIPADGYFEWQQAEESKYPHYHLKHDESTFFMAGISNITDKSSSFAILTHSASQNLSHIHHRMPVILKPDDWKLWIDKTSDLSYLISKYLKPQIELKFYQVHPRVNRVIENDKNIINEFCERQSTFF